MALTKAELADSLIHEAGIPKRDAKELVDCLFEEIRSSLVKGESVKISGFGNFELRDKTERPGRNPKTGEDVSISARRVVTFKVGQKLKSRVQHPECPQEEDGDKQENEKVTDTD